MTIQEAINYRTAFATIKRKLMDAGLDINEIKSFADLPAAVSCLVPENLQEQAEAILGDPETLASLLDAFTGAAQSGAVSLMFGNDPQNMWKNVKNFLEGE